MKKPALILPCSGPKLPGKLPAIEKYTGSAVWGLLRSSPDDFRLLTERCTIIVISAKYGVLSASDIVDDYDAVLNNERFASLQGQSAQSLKLNRLLASAKEVYIGLPKQHRALLMTWLPFACSGPYTTFPLGSGIGKQRSILKQWCQRILSETTFS